MGYYGGYYGMYFDPTYWLVIIGAVLCIVAQFRVSATFARYQKIRSGSGMTGAQAAQRILALSGINDVRVERIGGKLTDHYDPSSKVLRLSDSTYASTSIAAIGVAAHECGHALQHNKGYAPLQIRTALVPAANIGSKLGLPIILLGVLFGMNQLFIQIGIWVFALAVLFQIVTLPVEFNASSRAVRLVDQLGILSGQEVSQTKSVLGAAAMTYVAAAAASVLQLLRLVILFGGNRRRD